MKKIGIGWIVALAMNCVTLPAQAGGFDDDLVFTKGSSPVYTGQSPRQVVLVGQRPQDVVVTQKGGVPVGQHTSQPPVVQSGKRTGLILDPGVRVPQVDVPQVHVPQVHVPQVHVPTVQTPTVQRPPFIPDSPKGFADKGAPSPPPITIPYQTPTYQTPTYQTPTYQTPTYQAPTYQAHVPTPSWSNHSTYRYPTTWSWNWSYDWNRYSYDDYRNWYSYRYYQDQSYRPQGWAWQHKPSRRDFLRQADRRVDAVRRELKRIYKSYYRGSSPRRYYKSARSRGKDLYKLARRGDRYAARQLEQWLNQWESSLGLGGYQYAWAH